MVAPVVVLYCGVCTLPAEFCEFSGMHAECTQWWAKHHPEALEVAAGANAEAVTAALQAASLAGGAAAASSSAAASAEEPAKPAKGGKKKGGKPKVQLTRVNRSGRKYVTVVTGLEEHEIDTKKASKALSNKFACGCSSGKTAAGVSELVVQGDVLDELYDYILETWPTVSDDDIEVLGDRKGKRSG